MTPAEALAAAISGEDAAVYAYGVAGAHMEDDDVTVARAALDVHRARAASLRETLAATGAATPTPAAAYDLPFPVVDSLSARRLAAGVEERLAGLYAQLAAATLQDQRRQASVTARECASQAVLWGGVPAAFPGS